MKIFIVLRMKLSFAFIIALLLIDTTGATPLPNGYIIPKETLSPSRHYGFLVPMFSSFSNGENVHNALVVVKTGKVIAEVKAFPGFDQPINYIKIVPPWWSKDESVVLWKVDGKWSPTALVLLKFKKEKQVWQLDLLTKLQQKILASTKMAVPREYEEAKKANSGNGSSYPDGFTIDVEPVLVSQQSSSGSNVHSFLKFPLEIHIVLSSNPKQIQGISNLNASMDAIVQKSGVIEVRQFRVE